MQNPKVIETKEEFIEMMKLRSRIMNIKTPIKEEMKYSKVYNGKDFCRHFIIKDNDKIVSHITLHPMDMFIDNKIVKLAGIAGVITKEEYRNKGLMKELLDFVLKEMKNKKFDISILSSGDRKRYAKSGWERAGKMYEFTLNKKSISYFEKPKTLVKKYQKEDLSKIIKIHEEEKFKIKRNEKEYIDIMNNSEVFVAIFDNEVISYVVLKWPGKDRLICEFGGNDNGLQDIIRFIFEKFDVDSIIINSPVIFTSFNNILFNSALSWGIKCLSQGNCMIKIINLKSTLYKFLPQINNKLKKLGNTKNLKITLKILESNESVSLDINKERCEILEKTGLRKIVLSELDMVRLLFGITLPSIQFNLEINEDILDKIFPLDFYVCETDFV